MKQIKKGIVLASSLLFLVGCQIGQEDEVSTNVEDIQYEVESPTRQDFVHVTHQEIMEDNDGFSGGYVQVTGLVYENYGEGYMVLVDEEDDTLKYQISVAEEEAKNIKENDKVKAYGISEGKIIYVETEEDIGKGEETPYITTLVIEKE